MNNPYRKHLEELFDTIINLRHPAFRLNNVLKRDVEKYTAPGATYHSSSMLVLRDWTAQDKDPSWNSFPVGKLIQTTKEQYAESIRHYLSIHFCLLYAQSFEAFEHFLKNCMFEKASKNILFKERLYKNVLEPSRVNIPGGNRLFTMVKKAGGKSFVAFSESNVIKFKFPELWEILSETRHSITHSSGKIHLERINKSTYHLDLFRSLFEFSQINEDEIKIELPYYKLDCIFNHVIGFAFQIYKSISIEESLDWDIRDNKH